MAVKLRLMRMGKKKQPSYRVVAADSRKARNGRFIEIVGTYNPRQEPSLIEIDNERALHWLRHGAQPSERVQKLLVISGAWEEFTGVASSPPAKVTTAASAEAVDTASEAESAEAVEETSEAEPAEAVDTASEAESAEAVEETSEAESAEAGEGSEEDADKAEDGES